LKKYKQIIDLNFKIFKNANDIDINLKTIPGKQHLFLGPYYGLFRVLEEPKKYSKEKAFVLGPIL